MPRRIRLLPGGRLQRVTHIPCKWINYGSEDILLPWLSFRPSTLTTDGVDAGMGVFAEQPITRGTVVSEYNGKVRTKKQAEELVRLLQHTHLKSMYPNWNELHFDSRWVNGDTDPDADIPGIRMYLEGHFMAGLMNSAYLQVI